jgi:hypothetical protein
VRLEDCVVVIVVRGGGHCEAGASLELDEVEFSDLESAVLAGYVHVTMLFPTSLSPPNNNFSSTGLEKQNDFYIQPLGTLRHKGSVQRSYDNSNIT